MQEVNTDSIVLEEEIDPNYVPSEEEVIEYAKWLGMELDKDQDLFWIAREGLMAPLPKDWKPCRTKDTEDIYYFNFSTGDSTWDHPCDGYYKRLYEEEKKKKEIVIKESTDQNRSRAKSDVEKLLGKGEKKKKKKISNTGLSLQDVKEVQKAPFLGVLGHKHPLPDISQPPRSLNGNSFGSLSSVKTSLGSNSVLLDSKTTSGIDSDKINNNIENSRTEIAPPKEAGFVNSKLLSKFEPRYEIRLGNTNMRNDVDDSKGTIVSSSYDSNNHQESKHLESPDAKDLPIYSKSLHVTDDYLSVPSATIKGVGSQYSSWASFEGTISPEKQVIATTPAILLNSNLHIHKLEGPATNQASLSINTDNTMIEKTSLCNSDGYYLELSQEKDYFKNKCHDLAIRIEEYESLLTKYKNSYLDANEQKITLERKCEMEQLEWKEKLRKSDFDKDKVENECRQARIAFMDLELKYQSTNSEKNNELKALKEDIKLTKSELNRLIQVHQEAQHQLEDQHKNEIDSLKLQQQKELDENQKNMTSLQLKLVQMRDSYNNSADINHKKDILSCEQSTKDIDSEVSITKYNSLLAENISLKARYDDIYTQLQSCRMEENVLRNQIEMNRSSVENLQNTIKQLHSDLSQKSDIIRQQGDQIRCNDTKLILDEENISSKSKQSFASDELDMINKNFAIQIENYKERLLELELEKNNLLTQKSRQETELRHAKTDLNKYASINDFDRLEKDNLKSQIEFLKTENENLKNSTSSDAQQLIQQDKVDQDRLYQELSTERSIGLQKDKKVKSYQEELLQLQHRLNEKVASESELQHRLNEKIASESELQHRLNEKIASESELQHRLNEKIASESELQHRLNEKIASESELQHRLNENFVSDEFNVGYETNECLIENKEKIKSLLEQVKLLSTDLVILTNHNEILSASTTDLENSLSLKEREFQDFIKSNSLKIAQLESTNNHLLKQLSDRVVGVDVSDDVKPGYAGASATIGGVSSSMYKDLIQKKQVLEGEKIQLLVQINDLKHQLSMSQSRADNNSATIIQLETERDTYKEKLIESEKNLAQIKLSEKVCDMRSDVLMSEISTLRRELDMKKHETDNYDAMVKECELKSKQLEICRVEIESLKSNLNAMKSLESISSILATKENILLPSTNHIANNAYVSDLVRNYTTGNIPQQHIIELSLAVNQQQISMVRMEEYLMKTNKLILDLQQNNNTAVNVQDQRPASAPVQSNHQEVVRNNDIESNTEIISLLPDINTQYITSRNEEDSSDSSAPLAYHRGKKYMKEEIVVPKKKTNNKPKVQFYSKDKVLRDKQLVSKLFEMKNTLDNNTVTRLIQKYNILLKPLIHKYKCKDDGNFSSQSANLILLDVKPRIRIEYKFIKELRAHCVAAKKCILYDQACIRNLKALWRSQGNRASITNATHKGEILSTDAINIITMKANQAVDTLRATQELIKTREQKLNSIKQSIDYLEKLLITKSNDSNALHLEELIQIIEQRFVDSAAEYFTILNTSHKDDITPDFYPFNDGSIIDTEVLADHIIQHISPVVDSAVQQQQYSSSSSIINNNDPQIMKNKINTITDRLSKSTVFSSNSDILLQQQKPINSGLSLIRNNESRKRILQDQINKISIRQNQSQKDCEKHFGWLDNLNKEVAHMPHSYKSHNKQKENYFSHNLVDLHEQAKQPLQYSSLEIVLPWTDEGVHRLTSSELLKGNHNNIVHDIVKTTSTNNNMINESTGTILLSRDVNR